MTVPKKKVTVKRLSPAAKAQAEATAEVTEFLDISDLGSYMRGEVKPPEMLVPNWLQKGVLHWAQGEPEDGKSWVVLWCAVKLLQEDDEARVLIMDGEMGSKAVAERLRALGLDPATAEARVTHVNLSAVGREHWQQFVVWAHAMRFTLVIWDPIVHHLAGAGLNEDSNSDVQEWISQVVNPLLASGATVVGVDHLPKNGESKGYARGASAKKARSRLVYEFTKKPDQYFDRENVGEVLIALVKNSDAALIPKERLIVLGGKADSEKFLLRVAEVATPEVKVNRRREDARAVVDKAVAILEKLPPGEEVSASKLAQEIGGKRANTLEALKEAGTTAGGRLNQRTEESEAKRLFAYYSLRTDNGLR